MPAQHNRLPSFSTNYTSPPSSPIFEENTDLGMSTSLAAPNQLSYLSRRRSIGSSSADSASQSNPLGLMGTNQADDKKQAPFGRPIISDQNRETLDKYSSRRAMTSLIPFRQKPLTAQDSEHQSMMPRPEIGMCWGGTTLSEGASKMIKAALENKSPDEVLALVGDVNILANKQMSYNLIMSLSKLPFAFPLIQVAAFAAQKYFPNQPLLAFLARMLPLAVGAMPYEGLVHSIQLESLTASILKDNHLPIEVFKQLDLKKMDRFRSTVASPLRHHTTMFGASLPKNTERTRNYLFSIFPPYQHMQLLVILNDSRNFAAHTQPKEPDGTVGMTMNETGWQKIVGLSLGLDCSKNDWQDPDLSNLEKEFAQFRKQFVMKSNTIEST